jgi:hypothetical protein
MPTKAAKGNAKMAPQTNRIGIQYSTSMGRIWKRWIHASSKTFPIEQTQLAASEAIQYRRMKTCATAETARAKTSKPVDENIVRRPETLIFFHGTETKKPPGITPERLSNYERIKKQPTSCYRDASPIEQAFDEFSSHPEPHRTSKKAAT